VLQCPKILLEWCILCDFVTANVKKVAWKKMMAVHPQRTTKKQLKILRCEKCGLAFSNSLLNGSSVPANSSESSKGL